MSTSPRPRRQSLPPPSPEPETLPAERPPPPVEVDVPALPPHAVPEVADAGCLGLTRDEKAALQRELPVEWFAIRPQGEIYLPVDKYRRVLGEVFGPGDWCLVPTSEWGRQGTMLFREFTLYVRGRRASSPHVGGETWRPENSRMTYADAIESATSNALSRCCKELGIGLTQCYDAAWRDQFLEHFCVRVWVNEGGKVEARWRLKSAPPFTGTVTDERGQRRHGVIERSEVRDVTRAYRRPEPVREPGEDDQDERVEGHGAPGEPATPPMSGHETPPDPPTTLERDLEASLDLAAEMRERSRIPPPQTRDLAGVITDRQIQQLWITAREHGKTPAAVHEYLLRRYQLHSVKQLPRVCWDAFMQWVVREEPLPPGDACVVRRRGRR